MSRLRQLARFGVIAVGLATITGCAQTGDLGRVREIPGGWFSPSPTPVAEGTRILEDTDEERLMKQRLFRFTSFSQDQSWLSAVVQSARLTSRPPLPADYYTWLRSGDYSSSRGRYGRLLNDIEQDSLTLPEMFSAICVVKEIDRRRAIALTGLSEPDSAAQVAQVTRKSENDDTIAGFVTSLVFRYNSYAYALEQLLVDTPHEQARTVDMALNNLAAQVEFARAGQFCSPTASTTSALQL